MVTGQFDLPMAFIDSPEALADALPYWFDANLLAVDIECSLTGFHHCVLALLQVATHEKVWLVDPLSVPELMKSTLTAMSNIPWIVHDFFFFFIVFKRLYNVVPESVIDTMLLARSLGYPQPGLKKMTKIKLGLDMPKDEQDSNWMLRPLRGAQVSYASRDASVLLPLLRALAEEAKIKRTDPVVGPRLASLPCEMSRLLNKIHNYKIPESNLVLDKIRYLGLDEVAIVTAKKITKLRHNWGNLGDVSAVMELSNKWIIARLQSFPKTKDDLRKSISNPHFSRARIDDLWEVFADIKLPS
jgi:ribonuclease D